MTSLAVAVISLAGPAAAASLVQHLEAETGGQVRLSVLTSELGSVPQRRAQALREAQEEAVLLLEDTVRPAGGWLDAAQVALQNESLAAASGPVRCAPTLGARGRAWALHEYGPAIGAGTGERDTLPGHLLLLRREPVLAALGASDGLREDVIFPALRESGWRCQLLHGLAGEIVATDPRGASMRGQFGHGRGWSARESSRSGWTRRQRVLRLAAWPAVAAMHASRSMHGPLSPGIVMQIGALSAAWALGEGVGAVLGAGASEDHWA